MNFPICGPSIRGIEIVTININSAKIPDEDAKTIADLQRTAVLRNTGMAAGYHDCCTGRSYEDGSI